MYKALLLLSLLVFSSQAVFAQQQAKRPRRLVDILQVGSIVSYSSFRPVSQRGAQSPVSIPPTNYVLRLHTPAQRSALQKKEEEKKAEFEKSRNEYAEALDRSNALRAKERELQRPLRPANDEAQKLVQAELNAINELKQQASERMTARRSSFLRRPVSTRFFEVTEIGEDFICIEAPGKQLYIPVWSIRSISRDVEEEAGSKTKESSKSPGSAATTSQ